MCKNRHIYRFSGLPRNSVQENYLKFIVKSCTDYNTYQWIDYEIFPVVVIKEVGGCVEVSDWPIKKRFGSAICSYFV